MYIIRKNTYKIKDSLKAVGCKWNGKYKVWVFPNEKATKGFDFEVVESLSKLEVPQDKVYKKPFTASCITLNGVITHQQWLRGHDKMEIHLFTVKGRGECEGKTYYFSHSPHIYTQGEILEDLPCKISKSYGNFIYLDKILDI